MADSHDYVSGVATAIAVYAAAAAAGLRAGLGVGLSMTIAAVPAAVVGVGVDVGKRQLARREEWFARHRAYLYQHALRPTLDNFRGLRFDTIPPAVLAVRSTPRILADHVASAWFLAHFPEIDEAIGSLGAAYRELQHSVEETDRAADTLLQSVANRLIDAAKAGPWNIESDFSSYFTRVWPGRLSAAILTANPTSPTFDIDDKGSRAELLFGGETVLAGDRKAVIAAQAALRQHVATESAALNRARVVAALKAWNVAVDSLRNELELVEARGHLVGRCIECGRNGPRLFRPYRPRLHR